MPTRSAKNFASILSVLFWKGIGAALSLAAAVGIAHFFGASGATDAYFVARRTISNFASGFERLLHIMTVPGFVRLVREVGAPGLASTLWRLEKRAYLYAGGACAVAFAFAPMLVVVLAPGMGQEDSATAALFLRILLVTLPVSIAMGLSGAVLNAVRSFTLPVIARLSQRAFVVVALVCVPLGADLTAVVVAIVIGTAVMLVMFKLVMRRALASMRATGTGLETREPAGHGLAGNRSRQAAIVIAFSYQLVVGWFDTAVASFAGVGAIAIFALAQRAVNVGPGMMNDSAIAVFYTEFSESALATDKEKFRRLVGDALRAAVYFVLPIATLLFIFGRPLASILFGHGAFTGPAVEQAGALLQIFAVLALLNNVGATLMAASLADPGLPHFRMILSTVVIAFLLRALTDWALIDTYGVLAVATGAAVSGLGFLGVIFFWLSGRYGQVVDRANRLELGKLGLAALAAGLVAWAGLWALEPLVAGGRMGLIGLVGGLGVVAGLVYLGVGAVLGVQEVAKTRGALVSLASGLSRQIRAR